MRNTESSRSAAVSPAAHIMSQLIFLPRSSSFIGVLGNISLYTSANMQNSSPKRSIKPSRPLPGAVPKKLHITASSAKHPSPMHQRGSNMPDRTQRGSFNSFSRRSMPGVGGTSA